MKNTSALEALLEQCSATATKCFGITEAPQLVVSPYRFNPLGAHVDHQGGHVMARTLDQYTVLAYWPQPGSKQIELTGAEGGGMLAQQASFRIGDNASDNNWIRYAMAAANALNQFSEVQCGIKACVQGTLVGAGLSSSASVILAYLMALSDVNDIELTPTDLIELTRQVENQHMGLNNGIQDQMSVVYGEYCSMSLLDVNTATARQVGDPPNLAETSWLLCYSGFSRELITSGFNDRVSECRQAAGLLHDGVSRLADVPKNCRTSAALADLPEHLRRRAQHVYGEMQRVADGVDAWSTGNFKRFGELMNLSCQSSITMYECGSEPLIALHNLASDIPGVFGSRFSGGGYGGCLIMLVASESSLKIGEQLLEGYLAAYPQQKGVAAVLHANAESGVRRFQA